MNEVWKNTTGILGDLLTDLTKDVEQHPGSFDGDSVRDLITRDSAVRIALMKITEIKKVGSRVGHISLLMTAVVVCSQPDQIDRATAAADIVQTIITGLPDIKPTENCLPLDADSIEADNLFDDEIDRDGVALWAISWIQKFRP